jgi:hypothetical protein
MPKTLPKLIDVINEIKNDAVRNSLKAASNHLTDLSIRNIVDYIRILEIKAEGKDGR